MKTKQEQIEKMARSMCGYCSADGKCAVSKNGREPDICANVDTQHCLYKEYVETLIESGYGDISEYKAEIELLKADLDHQIDATNDAENIVDHLKYDLDKARKQAQIDVLNKLKNSYGLYYLSAFGVKERMLADILNPMIEELKDEAR